MKKCYIYILILILLAILAYIFIFHKQHEIDKTPIKINDILSTINSTSINTPEYKKLLIKTYNTLNTHYNYNIEENIPYMERNFFTLDRDIQTLMLIINVKLACYYKKGNDIKMFEKHIQSALGVYSFMRINESLKMKEDISVEKMAAYGKNIREVIKNVFNFNHIDLYNDDKKILELININI